MKRKFTKLMAALALLVFTMPSLVAWGQTREEATSTYIFTTKSWGATLNGEAANWQSGKDGNQFQNGRGVQVTTGASGANATSPSSFSDVSSVVVTYSTNASKGKGTIIVQVGSNTEKTYTVTPIGTTDVTTAFEYSTYETGSIKLTVDCTENSIYIKSIAITTGGSTSTLEDNDLALTGAPIALEFDLYDNSDAQVINYTTSSTGAVSVSSSDYINAVVDETAKTITVTPTAVTPSIQTITVSQAADETYAAGSTSFTVYIEDSTPFNGDIFVFNTDEGLVDLEITKPASGAGTDLEEGHDYVIGSVTMNCTHASTHTRVWNSNGVTELRVYSTATLTFVVAEGNAITKITVDGNTVAMSGLTNGVWTASGDPVRTVTLTATATNKINTIAVEYEANAGVIDTPTLPASCNFMGQMDVEITNIAQGATVYYTTDGTDPKTSTTREVYSQAFPVTSTTTVKAVAYIDPNYSAVAEATYTLVEPLATMQAIYDAATSTATNVYITFNNWVVSGVATNGKSVFVTDGTKGFVIYDNNGGLNQSYAAGNILSGTAVSCSLKKYNEYAQIAVDASALTITTGGTVNVAEIAMADLAGVNTGALVHYDNLTCSVDNNKYYLTDGTTTLQVYNALYAFGTLTAGKIYNITGVYQQYNNTKEILPRSAADIEEVVITTPSITVNPDAVNAPAVGGEYQHTITLENMTVTNQYAIDVYYCDENGEILQDQGNKPAWIEIIEITTSGMDYLVNPNEEPEVRTAYFKVGATPVGASDIVYSNLVTVTQAAYVAPAVPGNWVLTSLEDLTEDDVFVIVGTDADTEETYALPNNYGTSTPLVAAVTVVGNSLSGEISEGLQWNVSGGATGYTFYPNGNSENWLYCSTSNASGSNDNIRVGTGNRKVFVLDNDNYLVTNDDKANRYLSIYYNSGVAQDWRGYNNTNNNAVAISFYKKVDLNIIGYGEGTGNYYLIASPITVNPDYVVGMTQNGEYDLYAFDQTGGGEDGDGKEWRNFKQSYFDLEPGKGYLYAHKTDVGLIFREGTPYEGDGSVSLVKDDEAQFAGWNLIGNPYATAANVSAESFYRMNPDGRADLIEGSGLVNAMEGIFVIAESDGEEVTFSPSTPSKSFEQVAINVIKDRGTTIDRAVVRFGEGRQLPKFQLNPNNTKIYVTEGNQDYAVVRSAAEAEMPMNFKASKNGTYTLAVEAENVEMNYLHLIDNMTGMDVDLLQTPSYTFEAKTSDYASRFRLIFKASSTSSEANETFAYFNGSNWTVSNLGEATLQVVDVTGRTLSSETINGNATISLNQTPGVYMLRLVNGNSVKVQKVVVR